MNFRSWGSCNALCAVVGDDFKPGKSDEEDDDDESVSSGVDENDDLESESASEPDSPVKVRGGVVRVCCASMHVCKEHLSEH